MWFILFVVFDWYFAMGAQLLIGLNYSHSPVVCVLLLLLMYFCTGIDGPVVMALRNQISMLSGTTYTKLIDTMDARVVGTLVNGSKYMVIWADNSSSVC